MLAVSSWVRAGRNRTANKSPVQPFEVLSPACPAAVSSSLRAVGEAAAL